MAADEHLHGARRWGVLVRCSSRSKGVDSAAGGRETGVARHRGSQAAPGAPCWLLAAVIRQRHRSTCLENSKSTELDWVAHNVTCRSVFICFWAVSKEVFEKHWAGDVSSPWSRSRCTVPCPDQPHGPMPGRRCHRITVSNSHSHFLACRHHNYAAHPLRACFSKMYITLKCGRDAVQPRFQSREAEHDGLVTQGA